MENKWTLGKNTDISTTVAYGIFKMQMIKVSHSNLFQELPTKMKVMFKKKDNHGVNSEQNSSGIFSSCSLINMEAQVRKLT